MVLLGTVLNFDWIAAETVPVTWFPFVFGDGPAPVHLYVNKWVQIRHFQSLKVTQRRDTIGSAPGPVLV